MSEILPPLDHDAFTHDAMAVLIHDIGNYIQIAMSAMRLMARHEEMSASSPLGAMIAQAEDSLGRAGALIRQSRTHPMDGEETRLDECLTEMSTLLRYVAGPRIRVRLHVGMVPTVRVNRLGLQNVLVNLAINARDAMPTGGVLTLSALFADGPETPEVEIVVADTGTGMERDVLARAFEPRFSTKPTGSGMGLAGARHFVEAAGGRIAISSAPGRGAAVTLRLPVSP
jgi:signal transduction histidine kinase